MTPFELAILLHYYGSPTDPDEVKRNPPILAETMEAFVNEELICRQPEGGHGTWELTDRGRAYILFVLAVPLPVNTWQLPDLKRLAGVSFPDRRADAAPLPGDDSEAMK